MNVSAARNPIVGNGLSFIYYCYFFNIYDRLLAIANSAPRPNISMASTFSKGREPFYGCANFILFFTF